MRLDVRHNLGDIAKQMNRLRDDMGDKVMARTLNKVADGAAGQAATNVSAEFMIKKGEVRKSIRVIRAAAKAGQLYLSATVMVQPSKRGRGLNVIRFIKGPRVKGGRGRRQLGIQIKHSGGKQMIKGAFIGNDGRTVFVREGNGRTPIRAVATIDIAQMFNSIGRGAGSANVKGKTIEYILKRLPIVAAQEVRNVLRAK